jgi:hypothetical protein
MHLTDHLKRDANKTTARKQTKDHTRVHSGVVTLAMLAQKTIQFQTKPQSTRYRHLDGLERALTYAVETNYQ